MYGTFWALVPPLVAIVLALIIKEAYSALFIGVIIGAMFCANFAPVGTLDIALNDGLISAIADNAGIFLFLVLLGIIGALVLGIGMCMTMIWNSMAAGIVVGIAGIVLLICLIPAIKGIK